MSPSHHLAFVKVLAAVAWADGSIDTDERNRIKTLLNGFDLDLAERKQVAALLEEPVGFEEAVELTKDFAASMAPPGARRRLLREVEKLLGAEGQRAEPERELLRHVRAILESRTPIDGLADRLRGLFGRAFFGRPAADSAGPSRAELDEEFLRTVGKDNPAGDSALQRTCADYARRSTMEDRLHVLETLFERATADDGVISKSEADHIRRIVNILWISQPEYLAVRDRWRGRIAS